MAPRTIAPRRPGRRRAPGTLLPALTAVLALGLLGCTPRPDAEAMFLADLNQRRQAAGLAPLEVRNKLEATARAHAAAMVSNGLGHARNLTLGGHPASRRFAENVGRGSSVSAIAEALWASPSHRANIVGPYTGVGIGAFEDDQGQLWVTFQFEG